MTKAENTARINWVREYDGYVGEPIWKRDRDESTFYSPVTDAQCVLPLPSVEELERELNS